MPKQAQEPLPLVVQFASSNAPTLQQLLEGEAAGALKRLLEVLLYSDQYKQTPEPVEVPTTQAQAS